MADFNVSTSIDIKFTEEEIETLEKAKRIIDSMGTELWRVDHEQANDLAYLFTDVGENLKRIIEEDY